MAATDSRPVPRKNEAYRVYLPILDADGDLVTAAAGLDSEVSKDGAAFADCTNEATEIGSSGIYYLDLTAAEMNADAVALIVKTSTTGAKTTPVILYPEEAGDIRVNVTQYGGTNGTFAAGRPEVNVTHYGGTAGTFAGGRAEVNATHLAGTAFASVTFPSNVTQISGDATAADNAEAFFDGTGYAGTNNVIPTVTSLTDAPGDSAGVASLLGRLTSGRATALDNLDAAVTTRLAAADYTAPANASIATILTTANNFLTMIELDGSVYRFTTNALEQAPTGGSAPSAADIRAELDANSTKLANLDAAVTSRMATFTYTAPPTAAAVRTEMDSNSTKLANLDALVSSRMATFTYTAPPTANDVRDAVNAQVIRGTVTRLQAERRVYAFCAGLVSGAGTGTEVFKGADGTTSEITFTVDSLGNRTAAAYGA